MTKAPELTKREKQILLLLADGLTTQKIADKWILSTDTVNAHRKNIIKKLKVNNVTAAVGWALRTGVIK